MCWYWGREYVVARTEFEVTVHLETPVVIFPSLSVWVREAMRKLGRTGEVVGDIDMKKLLLPQNWSQNYTPEWRRMGIIFDATMDLRLEWWVMIVVWHLYWVRKVPQSGKCWAKYTVWASWSTYELWTTEKWLHALLWWSATRWGTAWITLENPHTKGTNRGFCWPTFHAW